MNRTLRTAQRSNAMRESAIRGREVKLAIAKNKIDARLTEVDEQIFEPKSVRKD
jgi:hypothetical protein